MTVYIVFEDESRYGIDGVFLYKEKAIESAVEILRGQRINQGKGEEELFVMADEYFEEHEVTGAENN